MSQLLPSKIGLTDLHKAAERIASDGLYSLILDDMLNEESERKISIGRIEEILSSSTKYLDEYRRLNKEHGVSNIDVRPTDTAALTGAERKPAEEFNARLEKLRDLERFSSAGSSLGYGMWVGSGAVLTIFALHNVFAMFTQAYRDYPSVVYGLYVAVCIAGVGINSWLVNRHNRNHAEFEKLYTQTVEMFEHTYKDQHDL